MISSTNLNAYIEKLANRRDCFYIYGRHGVGWRLQKEQLEPHHIRRHLAGEATLSFPALSEASTCKWLGFDFDDDSNDIHKVKNLLLSLGWSVWQDSKREGRAGHLMMLFDRPVAGGIVRRVSKEFLIHATVDNRDLEVFPKQGSLTGTTIGNGLRMPLGINQKSSANGARGWIEGVEKDIEIQMTYLLNFPLNSADKIEALGLRLLQEDERKLARKVDLQKYQICRRHASRERVSLLNHIPTERLKRCGNGYYTRCPRCEQEGNDRSGTNLWISPDGLGFKCFRNNGEHTTLDILQAMNLR